MAITFPDYIMMMRLKQKGQLKPGSTLMEIGKQNWCADIPLDKLISDTPDMSTTTKLWSIFKRDQNSFKIVEHYYRNVLGIGDYKSIDPGVADSDYKFDLNYPLPERTQLWSGVTGLNQFDIVTDSGTGEHIFNQAQLFNTMHDLTKKGGIMTHVLPWTGWYNHGFYNFQPTLIYDLALANDYTLLDVSLGGVGLPFTFDMMDTARWDYLLIGLATSPDGVLVLDGSRVRFQNSTISFAFRKNSSKAFKIPNQGAYAEDIKKPVKRVHITLGEKTQDKLLKRKS